MGIEPIREDLIDFYGDGFKDRRYAVSEENYNNHFVPGRAVMSDKYRYIKNDIRICLFDFLILEIELSNADFRGNLDVFNFYPTDKREEELYDLENDPGERINLADNSEYKQVLEEIRETLFIHLKETNDPFADFRNEIRLPEKAYALIRTQRNATRRGGVAR